MSEHAILAPSAADEWVECTGAPMLRALVPPEPEIPGSPAAEGTAAHESAEEFTRLLAHGQFLPGARDVVGQTAANGETITDGMYDGAVMYARDIQRVMQSTGVFTPHLEERTTPGGIHPACWGTPDCWLWHEDKRILYLWDYKFGRILREPTSYQFVCYVADILHALDVDGLQDQKTTVAIRVVQPRGYHRLGPIREWRGTAAELRPRINKARYAADRAMSNPECVVGPQCEHCEARPCDVLREANLARLRWVGSPGLPEMSDADAGVELKLLRLARDEMDAHITGLEARVEQAIGRGELVPGWVMERKTGNRAWTKPHHEVFDLGAVCGIELRKPEAPITPTQAIKAGIDQTIIEQYSARKPGACKLIEDTSSTRAQEAFDNGN